MTQEYTSRACRSPARASLFGRWRLGNLARMIDYNQALAETGDVKRHLLLGNGFSIALFPNIFTYRSLLDRVDFRDAPHLRLIFDELNTVDFERVIRCLMESSRLLRAYDVDEDVRSALVQDADWLKERLVQAIASGHPSRPSEISEGQYLSCRRFLANFIGQSRVQARDLRGQLYTLNYDLLVYWTLLHDAVLQNTGEGLFDFEYVQTEPLRHDDGFRAPPDDPLAEYVSWDGEAAHEQCVHFMHGALHLFDAGFRLDKLCWERTGRPLVDQVRQALDEGRFPLFVAEGDTAEKLAKVRHHGYLHRSLRSFRQICQSRSDVVFVFGHSLDDNDAHVLRHIGSGKLPRVYVGYFGDPLAEANERLFAAADRWARTRERYPLEVNVFSVDEVNPWLSFQ